MCQCEDSFGGRVEVFKDDAGKNKYSGEVRDSRDKRTISLPGNLFKTGVNVRKEKKHDSGMNDEQALGNIYHLDQA